MVKEAFGSGSDSEGSGKERDSPKKRKRSGSRRSSDSEGIIAILIKCGKSENKNFLSGNLPTKAITFI